MAKPKPKTLPEAAKAELARRARSTIAKERNAQRKAQQELDAEQAQRWREHVQANEAFARQPKPATLADRLPILIDRAYDLEPNYDPPTTSLSGVRCVLIIPNGKVCEGFAIRVGFERLDQTQERARAKAVAIAVVEFNREADQEFNARNHRSPDGRSRADVGSSDDSSDAMRYGMDGRPRVPTAQPRVSPTGSYVGLASEGGKRVTEVKEKVVYKPSPGSQPQVTERTHVTTER